MADLRLLSLVKPKFATEFDAILAAAKKVEPDRTGGYLCIGDSTGAILGVYRFGDPSAEKEHLYIRFCQEKVKRLAKMVRHKLSWQSRNKSRKQYGGAVRHAGLIFSFSGFSELMDEAIVMKFIGCLDMPFLALADEYVLISHNTSYASLQLAMVA